MKSLPSISDILTPVSQLLNPDVTVLYSGGFLRLSATDFGTWFLTDEQKCLDVYDIRLKQLAYLTVWFCLSKLIFRSALVSQSLLTLSMPKKVKQNLTVFTVLFFTSFQTSCFPFSTQFQRPSDRLPVTQTTCKYILVMRQHPKNRFVAFVVVCANRSV